MADDIFTDDELKAEQQQPGAEETPEQKADRERDEQGRFKAKEPDEATPAAAAEAAPEAGAEDDGKQKTVPQQALHAEREKRKALEAELAPLKEQLAALAKMREQVASRQAKPIEASAEDPNGVEAMKKRIAELEQSTTRVAQHIDTQAIDAAEMQQLGGVLMQSETRYRETQPDYDAAIDHVVAARAQELALYGLTPPQIQQTIREEATEIVRAAISQNRDPAEMGYQIALSRGYRPKEAEAKPNSQENAAQRTLDAIAEARKQNKSLGGGGGGKAPVLNAEAVLAMSPEEFDALYSTPEGKAMIDGL